MNWDELKMNFNELTERQKDRKRERQKDRKTERQKDKKTERKSFREDIKYLFLQIFFMAHDHCMIIVQSYHCVIYLIL